MLIITQQLGGAAPDDSMKLLVVLIIVISFISIMAIILIIKSKKALQEQFQIIESQHSEIEEKNNALSFNVESLKELNIEKNNIISVAAHDLRTPLDNIEGLVNLVLLEKVTLSEDQMKYLKLVKETTIKARSTITNILDIHKIESEQEQMELTRVNYLDSIKEIIKGFEETAFSKNIGMVFEYEHIRTDKINTDRKYFKQIISNLLSNAIKYANENTKVVVLVIETENTIRISVVDQGPGIDDNLKKRLFAPYSQLKKGGKDKVTGLGLMIARKLVERLNGKFRLETVVGEGSTFSVEFFK